MQYVHHFPGHSNTHLSGQFRYHFPAGSLHPPKAINLQLANSKSLTNPPYLKNVQKSIDKLVFSLPSNNQQSNNVHEANPKSKTHSKKKKMLPLGSSNRPNIQNFVRSPCTPMSSSRRVLEAEGENKDPEDDDNNLSIETLQRSEKPTPTKSEDGDVSSREGTPCFQRSSSANMRKMQKMFQNAAEENVRSIRAYVTELKECFAKLQYQKQLLICQGDKADQIYMEVELHCLTWLQQHFAELGNASPAPHGDGKPPISLSASIKALKREREFLAKRLITQLSADVGSIKALKREKEFLAKRLIARLSAEERHALHIKWEVPLDDGKHRKLQFVNKLWTDPNDSIHVQESSEIVVKLVEFCESGNVSREMFELNFALPSEKRPWFLGCNPISNLIHL